MQIFPPLDAEQIDAEPGAHVSGDIASVAVVDCVPWVATAATDGTPAILRQRPTGEWVVATWAMTVPPAPLEFDARGLRLRVIGSELWAVTTDTIPANLYRIMGTVRVDRVSGADNSAIRCAHDLAESADGNMLMLSCDNELQEILAAGRDLTVLRSWPALPSESTPGGRTWELIVPDGGTVFVALNTQTQHPTDRPVRARIVRVDDGGSTPLFDEANVIIKSMAATPRDVLVVLRHADGTSESRRIAREQ